MPGASYEVREKSQETGRCDEEGDIRQRAEKHQRNDGQLLGEPKYPAELKPDLQDQGEPSNETDR